MTLRGHIDVLSYKELSGWAQDTDVPDKPVSLLVEVDGKIVGKVLANAYREDLRDAGIGDGRHAFQFLFRTSLGLNSRANVRIFSEAFGADLPGSPREFGSHRPFDEAAKSLLSDYLASSGDDRDAAEKIRFLATLISRYSDCLGRNDHEARRFSRDLERRWRLRDGEFDAAETAPPERHLSALIVDPRTPSGSRDAGSNALLGHAGLLRKIGFDIRFVAADEFESNDQAPAVPGVMEGVRLGQPFYSSVEDVLIKHARQFDLVYLHRVDIASRYAALVRKYQPDAHLVFSVADLHYLRLARQAIVERRAELMNQSRAMMRQEMLSMLSADSVITHSSFEAENIRQLVPPEKVHVVRWPVVAKPRIVPFADRNGFAFIGYFAHQPNIDAVVRLIKEIVPRVSQRLGGARCLIVGSDLPNELIDLCDDRIEYVGAVENLDDVFDKVRLTVAPLGFGAGIKGKIIDSLAAGVPCVCTKVAAEGLDLPAQLIEHVHDDDESFVNSIVKIHEDARVAAGLSVIGLEYIADKFSELSVLSSLKLAVVP